MRVHGDAAPEVELVVVPYDTARRGWRSGAGPEHLLGAGLVAHLTDMGHRVRIRVIEPDPTLPLAEIATAFELMRRVSAAVRTAHEAGRFPLVLGGNCNLAVGTLSGLSPACAATFWFDAHGDCNTPETTTSGFLDGTGLATALGLCWRGLAATVPGHRPARPDTTFLLGARHLDPAEAMLIEVHGISTVPGSRIAEALPTLLDAAPLQDCLGYVHLDLDVPDPETVGRANALPVPGGLSVELLTGTIESIRARLPLGAATLASYAPEFDEQGVVCRAAFAAIDAILA